MTNLQKEKIQARQELESILEKINNTNFKFLNIIKDAKENILISRIRQTKRTVASVNLTSDLAIEYDITEPREPIFIYSRMYPVPSQLTTFQKTFINSVKSCENIDFMFYMGSSKMFFNGKKELTLNAINEFDQKLVDFYTHMLSEREILKTLFALGKKVDHENIKIWSKDFYSNYANVNNIALYHAVDKEFLNKEYAIYLEILVRKTLFDEDLGNQLMAAPDSPFQKHGLVGYLEYWKEKNGL